MKICFFNTIYSYHGFPFPNCSQILPTSPPIPSDCQSSFTILSSRMLLLAFLTSTRVMFTPGLQRALLEN